MGKHKINIDKLVLKMQSNILRLTGRQKKGCRVDFSDEFVSKNICLTVGAKQ